MYTPPRTVLGIDAAPAIPPATTRTVSPDTPVDDIPLQDCDLHWDPVYTGEVRG